MISFTLVCTQFSVIVYVCSQIAQFWQFEHWTKINYLSGSKKKMILAFGHDRSRNNFIFLIGIRDIEILYFSFSAMDVYGTIFEQSAYQNRTMNMYHMIGNSVIDKEKKTSKKKINDCPDCNLRKCRHDSFMHCHPHRKKRKSFNRFLASERIYAVGHSLKRWKTKSIRYFCVINNGNKWYFVLI